MGSARAATCSLALLLLLAADKARLASSAAPVRAEGAAALAQRARQLQGLNHSAPPTIGNSSADLSFTARTEWVCVTAGGVFGMWFAACFAAMCVVKVVVCRRMCNGPAQAVPLLAGLRTQLFIVITLQGVVGGLQSFRGSGGGDEGAEFNCGPGNAFMLVSEVPMQDLPMEWKPAPLWLMHLGAAWEAELQGYLMLFMFLTLPQARSLYAPESDAGKRRHWPRRFLPPALMLALLGLWPLAVLVCRSTVGLAASEALSTLVLLAALPLLLWCSRDLRHWLDLYFEQLHLQEWSVASANVLLQLGKLFLALAFDEAPARFFMGFASILYGMITGLHATQISPPARDPLLWLARAEWLTEQESQRSLSVRDIGAAFWWATLDARVAMRLALGGRELHRLACWIFGGLRRGLLQTDAELKYGRAAWNVWQRCGCNVPPVWWGLQGSPEGCLEAKQVTLPAVLTREEQELQKQGKLTRRSTWRFVLGDLFSDRVRNAEIGPMLFALTLATPSTWAGITTNFIPVPELLEEVSHILLLVQSFLFCLFLWFIQSLLLYGNNPFLSRCTGLPYDIVLLIVSLLLAWGKFVDTWRYDQALADREFLAPDLTMLDARLLFWWNFFAGVLLLALSCTFLRHCCTRWSDRARDTYHHLEFAAQRYSQVLLRGELSSQRSMHIAGQHCALELEEGQAYTLQHMGTQNRCLLRRKNPDGTVRLLLEGGAEIDDVLVKYLKELDPFKRVEHDDLSMVDQTRKALAPMLQALNELRERTGANAQMVHKEMIRPVLMHINESSRSLIGWEALREDRAEEAEAEEQQAQEALEADALAEERQAVQELTAQPQSGAAEAVKLACHAGVERREDISRERLRATALRSFFIGSVGLPPLMLIALLVSGFLVVMSSLWLASLAQAMEVTLRRTRTLAALGQQLQSKGLAEACDGDLAPAVQEVFDSDLSQRLDSNESQSMSSYLTLMLSVRMVSGSSASMLTPWDFERLAAEAAEQWPSHRGLPLPGTRWLLCEAAGLLDAREAKAQVLEGVLTGSQHVTAGDIVTLLDQAPYDGALTEEEVLRGLGPGLAKLPPQQQDAMRRMIHLTFVIADVDPADGKIAGDESATFARDVDVLVQGMPRLMEAVAAALVGDAAGPPLDGALLLQALDLDQNGCVDRQEVARLALILETITERPGVAEYLFSLYDQADTSPRDGCLDRAELDVVAGRMAQLLKALRLLSALLQQPGAAGGGAGGSAAQAMLDPQLLLTVLDRDGDGLLNQAEFDGLAALLPPPQGHALFLLGLVFQQADTSPTDGQLSQAELSVAVDRLKALGQGLVPEASGSPAPAGPSRRLQGEVDTDQAFGAALSLLGVATNFALDGRHTGIRKVADSFLSVFTSNEYALIAPLVVLGVRLAILAGLGCTCWMLALTRQKHEELAMRMESGDWSYLGATHREDLRNSFSTSTTFPGMLVAQAVINLFMATFTIFVAIVLVVTPTVLLIIPGTRPLVLGVLVSLRFPVLAALVKYALKRWVVDRLLVEHGQPVYPAAFSALWVMLVLLNFVQAPFLGVFRYIYLALVSLVRSSYIHTTILSEKYMSLDPGYFAFISLTFTQSSRRNLLRQCFISSLMPQVHRARGEEPQRAASEQRARRLRMRNKLWLAVTLRNNPELRVLRRRKWEKELQSLTGLWGALQGASREDPELEARRKMERQRAKTIAWASAAAEADGGQLHL